MKKTAILIAALILIPALTLGSVLFLLHRSDEPEDESAQVDFSETDRSGAEESSAEESAAENDCAHEYTVRTYKTPEQYPAPAGAYGTHLTLCSDCGATLEEHVLWRDGQGIVYYTDGNGGCTVCIVERELVNADRYDIPETVAGLPVTAIDAAMPYPSAGSTLGIPASVGLFTEYTLNSLQCLLDIDPSNPYYSFTGGCLIDMREKAVIYHAKNAPCIIPADGSVTKIAHNALLGISGELKIPASVTEIYGDSITAEGELVLTLDPANETFIYKDNCLINVAAKTLVMGFNGAAIPADGSVERIDAYAFFNKGQLRGISLFMPASVKYIGKQAFASCNVKLLTIEDLDSWCRIQFADLGSTPVKPYVDTRITDAEGNSFNELTIPDPVTEINDYCFYGWRSLERVKFHANVTRIGAMAFCSTALTEIELPEALRELGTNAFANCRIASVYLPAGLERIGAGCFKGYGQIDISAGFTDNGHYALKNGCVIDVGTKTLILGCAESVIPDDGSVERIGEGAFSRTKTPVELIIPDPVKYIDRDAFAACFHLQSVSFPAGIEYIDPTAFAGCTLLTKIYAYSGTVFPENAFSGSAPEIIYLDKQVEE
ncbi:MAG: leucine-rich repeat domain-containing protein [Clostridia bacterium]|nr:leucine-rich repeat domain-containing protein [Clostridia bacterium]